MAGPAPRPAERIRRPIPGSELIPAPDIQAGSGINPSLARPKTIKNPPGEKSTENLHDRHAGQRIGGKPAGQKAQHPPTGPHERPDEGVGAEASGMVGQMGAEAPGLPGQGKNQGAAHADAVPGTQQSQQKHGRKVDGNHCARNTIYTKQRKV